MKPLLSGIALGIFAIWVANQNRTQIVALDVPLIGDTIAAPHLMTGSPSDLSPVVSIGVPSTIASAK